MSFRTAYSDYMSSGRSSRRSEFIRDKTPEQWEKNMQEYYKRQAEDRQSFVKERKRPR